MALAKTTLVRRVRDLLDDYPWESTISEALTAGETDVDVPDGTDYAEGDIIEYDDGEQQLVKSIASNTLTVTAGYNGTTAAAHNSGDRIVKNPVYTYKKIVDSIDLVIQAYLWPYVWKTVQDSITPSTSQIWYDLAATAIDLVRVYQEAGTPTGVFWYGEQGTGKPIVLERGLQTATVASTVGVRFPGGFYHGTNTVYIDYRAKVTAGISGNDYSDLSDGILAEIIAYGAAARLVGIKEVGRMTSTDVSMGDATVQPGERWSLGQELWGQFTQLRNIYNDELIRTNPPMKRWRR